MAFGQVFHGKVESESIADAFALYIAWVVGHWDL